MPLNLNFNPPTTTKCYQPSLKPKLKTKNIAIKEITDFEIEAKTKLLRDEEGTRMFQKAAKNVSK